MPRGGARPGAGRRKLYDEIEAVNKAKQLEPKAWACLEKAVDEGNTKAAELVLAYANGKPAQSMDLTSKGDKIEPLIIITNASQTKSMAE